MRRFSSCIIVIIISLSILSCSKNKLKKGFEQGFIEYSITYDKSLITKYDPNLLPKVMLIKFYKGSMLNKVEGLSGSVSFTYITNRELQKNITLIKLMNKRLYFDETIVEGKYPNSYSEMPKISIKKTDKTIKYKGFHCNHAIGTFEDASNYTFDIYYTREIKIDNPNANTPFESIDGIMLKFDVKLYNKLMTLSATNIKATEISFDEFFIPENYEKITEETVKDVISLLQ